jgi:hypothetical protein
MGNYTKWWSKILKAFDYLGYLEINGPMKLKRMFNRLNTKRNCFI